MTHISLAIVFLLAVPLLAFSQVTQEKTTQNDDETAIRRVLDEQGAALKRKDVSALDRIWAPDYLFVNPTGQVIAKEQRLKVLGSGDTRIDLLSRDEVNVRIYGNAAVVIALTAAKGRVGGRDVDARFRSTAMLVKRYGDWLIVSHQDNIVPP